MSLATQHSNRVGRLGLACLAGILLSFQPAPLTPSGVELTADTGILSLPAGERRAYRVRLDAGEILRLDLERFDQEASLSLAVDHRTVAQTDGRFGAKGHTSLTFLAPLPTEVQVRVESSRGHGSIRLRRPSLPSASRLAAAFLSRAHAEGLANRSEASASAFLAAAHQLAQLGFDEMAAHAWDNAGTAALASGQRPKARQYFHQALALFRRTPSTYALGWIHLSLGRSYYQDQSDTLAMRHYGVALAQALARRDLTLEAATRRSHATCLFQSVELREACRLYQLASQLYLRVGRTSQANSTSFDHARCWIKMGQDDKAHELLRIVESRASQSQDRALQARAIREMGVLQLLDHRPAEALATFDHALQLTDPADHADIHFRRGEALLGLEQFTRAVEAFQAGLQTTPPTDEIRRRVGLEGLCHTYARAGLPEVRRACRETLEIPSMDLMGEQLDWYHWAIGEAKLGAYPTARQYVQQAIALVEEARPKAGSHEERRSFFSHRLPTFEFAIQLELQQGNDEAAFELFERTLARTLLDGLTQEKQTTPLTLAEIQRLLDQKTTLVAFHFAEPRSSAWVIGRKSFRRFDLSGRKKLGELAEAWRGILGTPGTDFLPPEHERRRGEELAEELWRPIQAAVTTQRLVIVGDGLLERLPWAALPVPATKRRLVEDHEITLLPSMTVLASLRRKLPLRSRGVAGILAIGDPVYAGKDPRAPEIQETAEDEPVYDRLEATAEEIAAISKAARSRPFSSLTGFAANREAVLAGHLRGFRILHLAAHGEGGVYPRIFLSQVDATGKPRRGAIDLADLATLQLDAELAVLSACESGGSEVVPGDGLVGLGRGFMHAGVPRLVVSLWKTRDQPSARFMGEYYQALFGQGAGSAHALRETQRKALAAGVDPRIWSAFVHLGEWR